MTRPFTRALALLALAVTTSVSASAQDHEHVMAGNLRIEGAWTRATPPQASAAGGYVTITNEGDTDDRLSGGSANGIDKVEIHEMAMDGDVMKMRPLADGLPIPAGETVTLEPGGLHLMMMGLSDPFKAGDTIAVSLTFEKSGSVTIMLPVQPLGAKGPADGATDHSHSQ